MTVKLTHNQTTLSVTTTPSDKGRVGNQQSGVFVFPTQLATQLMSKPYAFPYYKWDQQIESTGDDHTRVRSQAGMSWMSMLLYDDEFKGDHDLGYESQDGMYWLYHDFMHAVYDCYHPNSIRYPFVIATNPDAELRALYQGAILAHHHGVPVDKILAQLRLGDYWSKNNWKFPCESVEMFTQYLQNESNQITFRMA